MARLTACSSVAHSEHNRIGAPIGEAFETAGELAGVAAFLLGDDMVARVLMMALSEAVESGALAPSPVVDIPKKQRPTHKAKRVKERAPSAPRLDLRRLREGREGRQGAEHPTA